MSEPNDDGSPRAPSTSRTCSSRPIPWPRSCASRKPNGPNAHGLATIDLLAARIAIASAATATNASQSRAEPAAAERVVPLGPGAPGRRQATPLVSPDLQPHVHAAETYPYGYPPAALARLANRSHGPRSLHEPRLYTVRVTAKKAAERWGGPHRRALAFVHECNLEACPRPPRIQLDT